jgi:hypothetical protein
MTTVEYINWLFLGLAAMGIAIAIRFFFDKRRKRAITAAGETIGFHSVGPEETFPIVAVPLLNAPRRKFFIILRGRLDGYDAGYFDLSVRAGKTRFYQSTIVITNPRIMMPRVQLRAAVWRHTLNQRACNEKVVIDERENDMKSLRLSSDDPAWAHRTFAKAPSDLFDKMRRDKWTVEGLEHSLVLYRWGKTVSARNLQEFSRQSAQLAAAVFALCA